MKLRRPYRRVLGIVLAFAFVATHADTSWSLPEDLLPPPPSPQLSDSKKLEEEISKRRTRLQWHQALGLTLLPVLTATVVLGQINYNDVIHGRSTGSYQTPHLALAGASAALFAATAIAALSAPEPMGERKGFDTVKFHKAAMFVAALAMAAQVGLGVAARRDRGTQSEAGLAKAHLALGYSTLGLSLIGASAHLF